jgi:hypothetical protein
MKKLNWDDHSAVKELVKRFLATVEVTSARQIQLRTKCEYKALWLL